MREEPISFNELMEILGLENMTISEDQLYDLGPRFIGLEYEEMLEMILRDFIED
jgi:hypothetical protein